VTRVLVRADLRRSRKPTGSVSNYGWRTRLDLEIGQPSRNTRPDLVSLDGANRHVLQGSRLPNMALQDWCSGTAGHGSGGEVKFPHLHR
jgi:hypothetical protein